MKRSDFVFAFFLEAVAIPAFMAYLALGSHSVWFALPIFLPFALAVDILRDWIQWERERRGA